MSAPITPTNADLAAIAYSPDATDAEAIAAYDELDHRLFGVTDSGALYIALTASEEAEKAASALRAEIVGLGVSFGFVLRPTEEGFRVHGSNPAQTETLSQALQHLGYLIRWRSPEFIAVKMGPGKWDLDAAMAVRNF